MEKRHLTWRPTIFEENVDRIRQAFVRSPKKSTTRANLELAIPQSTVLNVLKKRLRFRPYKLQLFHHTSQHAKETRFDFSMMMCEKMDEAMIIWRKLYFLTKQRFIFLEG